jgi:hypothetical protein
MVGILYLKEQVWILCIDEFILSFSILNKSVVNKLLLILGMHEVVSCLLSG